MKNNLLSLLVALSLGSGSALAAVPSVTIKPNDVLAPTVTTNYTGSEYHDGAFTDKYIIDFTQFGHPDEWTFLAVATSATLNGNPLFGLTGVRMALTDVDTNTVLFDKPVTGVAESDGPLTWTNAWAYDNAIRPLGNYRFDVSGTGGSGYYNITLTVPEPETWAIFLTGIALLGLRLRNRQNLLG